VLPFLIERVLGVTILDRGNTVLVDPSLGSLEWAKGDIPLQKGVLHIEADGKQVKVQAPRGVKVLYKRFK
jgi:uncharacterized protein YijF (DUF1287 family)